MQILPTSSRRTGRGLVESPASRAIIGVVFAVVGAGLMWLLGGFLPEWWSARHWQSTQCEIRKSYVAVNRAGGRPSYRVIAEYRYDVGSKTFVGLRYRLDDAFSAGRTEKDEIVRTMPPGSRVPCWYDPAEPSRAVIDRGFGLAGLVIAVLPASFIVFGMGMVYGAVKPHRPIGPTAEARARLPRRVVLRLRRSRFYRLVESGGIAAFAAMFFLISSIQGSTSDLPPGFVATIVAGVVLFAMVRVGHATLALMNPEVRVEVESTSVALGEPVKINWSLSGKVGRIRRMAVTLEAREELEYGSGRNRHFRAKRIALIPLADFSSAEVRQLGSASVEIPKDVMHSLTAQSHRFVWAVRVNADLPHWADIDDEFQLEVAPSR